jgi:putative endonuclease
MSFWVYILYAASFDKFYVGQTDDLQRRIDQHNAGYVQSTKPYLPWQVRCTISKSTRSEALALEKKLKNLNKQRLKAFIEKYGAGPVG